MFHLIRSDDIEKTINDKVFGYIYDVGFVNVSESVEMKMFDGISNNSNKFRGCVMDYQRSL